MALPVRELTYRLAGTTLIGEYLIVTRNLPRGHSPLINVSLTAVDHRTPLLLTLRETTTDKICGWSPVVFGLMPHMSEEIMITTDLTQVAFSF